MKKTGTNSGSREDIDRQPRPSEVFGRYFGPEHGVELSEPHRYGIQGTSEDP